MLLATLPPVAPAWEFKATGPRLRAAPRGSALPQREGRTASAEFKSEDGKTTILGERVTDIEGRALRSLKLMRTKTGVSITLPPNALYVILER